MTALASTAMAFAVFALAFGMYVGAERLQRAALAEQETALGSSFRSAHSEQVR